MGEEVGWRARAGRACEAAAIARHGAVDLAAVPSTICRQCTRVVGECAGSRLAVPVTLARVRIFARDLDQYLSRVVVLVLARLRQHAVDGRDRERYRKRI